MTDIDVKQLVVMMQKEVDDLKVRVKQLELDEVKNASEIEILKVKMQNIEQTLAYISTQLSTMQNDVRDNTKITKGISATLKWGLGILTAVLIALIVAYIRFKLGI